MAPRTGGGPGPTLVIVESRQKATTIQKILGAGYEVRACFGHVRDLPEKGLGIDVRDNFRPTWAVRSDRAADLAAWRAAAAGGRDVVLATDLDREGESIAWDLTEELALDPAVARRVTFHEVTPAAIGAAFAGRRIINRDLVEAQRARRLLDRLIGYTVSPLLWNKVQRGLSAGRVQSVAVRIVVERDREIEAFVPAEYWTIECDLAPERAPEDRFSARLRSRNGKTIPKLGIPDRAAAEAVAADLRRATFSVAKIEEKPRAETAPPPFETSSMQIAAANRLSFSAKRTMSVAQELYEGISLGPEGRVGLITYMRTDSISVAEPAQKEARELIAALFGPAAVPDKPNTYKQRKKSAVKTQEAHECIRPTDIRRLPKQVRPYLSDDQFKLYQIVWRRFAASQMAAAVWNVRSAVIDAVVDPKLRYGLRTEVRTLVRPGWKAAWGITTDAAAAAEVNEAKARAGEEEDGGAKEADKDSPEPSVGGKLPTDLAVGEALRLLDVRPEQHHTEPPARYTEATLVRALKDLGIGRPSTYAPTLATIIEQRGYVERIDKALRSSPLGRAVADFLVERLPDHFAAGFTAKMEEDLDRIAAGALGSLTMLKQFWASFETKVDGARLAAPTRVAEPTGRPCPQCAKELVRRWNAKGDFVGCSGYPGCTFIERAASATPVPTGVACPRCGKDILERKNRRRGTTFYGCAGYPTCTFTLNDRPLGEACPACGHFLVERKAGKACPACTEAARKAPPAAPAKGEAA